MPDEGDSAKPLATAEVLVEIMLYQHKSTVKQMIREVNETMGSAIRTSVGAMQQLGCSHDDCDELRAANDKILAHLAKTLEEELASDELEVMIRDCLLKTVKEVYSPEQIDTLVNFYKSNPWAYENQTKFSLRHAGNSRQIQNVMQQKVLQSIPALMQDLGIDFPFESGSAT